MGSLLAEAMEAVMVQNPAHWRGHCGGSPDWQRVQWHFSYSDRIRYYWPLPEAQARSGSAHAPSVRHADSRANAQPIPAPAVSPRP